MDIGHGTSNNRTDFHCYYYYFFFFLRISFNVIIYCKFHFRGNRRREKVDNSFHSFNRCFYSESHRVSKLRRGF